jgi:hypothetical protein|tara:strand:+ start:2475 stop:3014 length:540 start_codon:yes stop_codon:yes gene_type:complete
MSRKTLLSEAQVRQFLKLADLGAVGDAKIQEMYGMPGARDEEDPDMDMGAGEDGAMDMGMDAEDEPDMDMDVPDEENSAAGMVSVDDFMGALESALEDVMGEPTSVEMDMDDEPDMDMDMGGAPDDEDEPDPMMEEEKEEEDVVNEVARRVAARLTKKNKNEQLVDQLAERILSRLTKK